MVVRSPDQASPVMHVWGQHIVNRAWEIRDGTGCEGSVGNGNALMVHDIKRRIRHVSSGRHEEITAIVAVGEGAHDIPCRRLEVARLESLLHEATAFRFIVLLVAHIPFLVGETYPSGGGEGEEGGEKG